MINTCVVVVRMIKVHLPVNNIISTRESSFVQTVLFSLVFSESIEVTAW